MIDVGLITTLANARLCLRRESIIVNGEENVQWILNQEIPLSQRAKSWLFPGILNLNTNISRMLKTNFS